MPYFTATAPPNVSAPSFFRDRGNTTDVPTSPSDISVSGVPPMISLYSQLFATNVCGFGLSSVDEMDLEVKAYYDTSAVKPHPHFFPNSPLVGLTFNDNQSQRVSELATRFGLSREVVSRRTFYKGHVSQEAALTLLANGAEADSYLPYGVASLGGLLTFYSLRRVLYVALKAFPMSQRATALAEEIKLPRIQPQEESPLSMLSVQNQLCLARALLPRVPGTTARTSRECNSLTRTSYHPRSNCSGCHASSLHPMME